jgi:hypothetical protein
LSCYCSSGSLLLSLSLLDVIWYAWNRYSLQLWCYLAKVWMFYALNGSQSCFRVVPHEILHDIDQLTRYEISIKESIEFYWLYSWELKSYAFSHLDPAVPVSSSEDSPALILPIVGTGVAHNFADPEDLVDLALTGKEGLEVHHLR